MRRRRFQILLAAGTLCLAAALCLAGYNIWDEQRATVSASEAVEVLVREIPDRPEKEQPLAPEPQPMMTSVERCAAPLLPLRLPGDAGRRPDYCRAQLPLPLCPPEPAGGGGGGALPGFGRQRVDLHRGRDGNYRRERRGAHGGGGLGFDPVHLYIRGTGAVYRAMRPCGWTLIWKRRRAGPYRTGAPACQADSKKPRSRPRLRAEGN